MGYLAIERNHEMVWYLTFYTTTYGVATGVRRGFAP
jgi:hypothetical protein